MSHSQPGLPESKSSQGLSQLQSSRTLLSHDPGQGLPGIRVQGLSGWKSATWMWSLQWCFTEESIEISSQLFLLMGWRAVAALQLIRDANPC